MVWSWVAGSYNVKEIRAVREIEAGEELCANYIDSFEVSSVMIDDDPLRDQQKERRSANINVDNCL